LIRGSGGRRAGGEKLSQHPTDQLIRELIAYGRLPSQSETAEIVNRVSTAEFDSRIIRVPESVRPHVPHRTERWDALSLHLTQRVAVDGQWIDGTTPDAFVGDLHAAAGDASARIAIYGARGGNVALVVADTRAVVRGSTWASIPNLCW